MTKFCGLPVGAYFTFFDNSDGTLCVKVSKTSSYNSYGTYRFADYRNPTSYLIADWCEVTPRSDIVIIRRDRQSGDLVAFMPENDANPGMVVCYAHIGQHSEASRQYMLGTKPVDYTAPEVFELVRELISMGYAVHLVKRVPSWRTLAQHRAA